MGEVKKPVFRDLTAEDEEPETTEIESLCLNCGENGMTRLLLTRIPFYKDIILMSFECEHCGNRNNEIQSGERIQEKGVRIEAHIVNARDLDRQVIKSDSASVLVPEFEFEIPPQSQKGEITTVEGILDRAISGLEQDQTARREAYPEAAEQIDAFIVKLKQAKDLDTPFTLIIDDPAGNSFVENPLAPHHDPAMKMTHYVRSQEQNHKLGIYSAQELAANDAIPEDVEEDTETKEEDFSGEKLENEVLHFATNCSNCNAPCETNMKMTNIPFFKEVIIMATVCDACGHRTNEVKSGTGIADQGTKITLNITDPVDLSRDVLKSETCMLCIPELDFEVGSATLGGRFTTIEGLLTSIKEQLVNENPLISGDSAKSDIKERLGEFGRKIDDILASKWMVHIVLDDPAGNSYLQNIYAPDPDPEMEIIHYDRTFDQNEELGLNDIKVEDY
nr:EOG090X06TU [Triops cancriformis]